MQPGLTQPPTLPGATRAFQHLSPTTATHAKPIRHRYKGWTYWQTRRGHWLMEHPTRGREWHQSYEGCRALIRQLEQHQHQLHPLLREDCLRAA